MTEPGTPERIAWLRGRQERDDWGAPAKDERSSLSVGEVGDLLLALDAAQAERDRAPLPAESWRQAWDRILADKRAAEERAAQADSRAAALLTERDGLREALTKIASFIEGEWSLSMDEPHSAAIARAALHPPAADLSTPKEPR